MVALGISFLAQSKHDMAVADDIIGVVYYNLHNRIPAFVSLSSEGWRMKVKKENLTFIWRMKVKKESCSSSKFLTKVAYFVNIVYKSTRQGI